MSHTYNMSHLEKWVTFKKCVKVKKIGHSEKMFHTWKNGSHLRSVSQLENWVTLIKKCFTVWKADHIQKISHLQKCFTVWKADHI